MNTFVYKMNISSEVFCSFGRIYLLETMRNRPIVLLFVMFLSLLAFNIEALAQGNLQIKTRVVGKVVDEAGVPIP